MQWDNAVDLVRVIVSMTYKYNVPWEIIDSTWAHQKFDTAQKLLFIIAVFKFGCVFEYSQGRVWTCLILAYESNHFFTVKQRNSSRRIIMDFQTPNRSQSIGKFKFSSEPRICIKKNW